MSAASNPVHARVARRFRYHARPGGPIAKEGCAFCVSRAGAVPRPPRGKGRARVHFHHGDYARPFRGCWTCPGHHALLDAGTLVPRAEQLRDYTAALTAAGKLKPGTWVESPF